MTKGGDVMEPSHFDVDVDGGEGEDVGASKRWGFQIQKATKPSPT
jgi:hypothetical protein